MSGLCECGCGTATSLASQTSTGKGWVKGQPLRFIRGHANSGRGIPTAERVDARLDKSGDCWIWTGYCSPSGYGRVSSAEGAPVLVHRFQYKRYVGPVPEGLQLDHLCRVRACANPEHLEPVTAAENMLRGQNVNVLAHLAGTCVRGHDASLSYRRRSTGRVVYCRVCVNEKRSES